MPATLIPPAYRLHKPTGLAVVRLNGKDFYLGQHGTDGSKAKYDRLIGEWMANGRQLATAQAAATGDSGGITVAEVLAAYFNHATAYYRKPDGSQTSEIDAIRSALKPLRRLYGRCSAADFGPLKLKAVQASMIESRWARTTINKHVGRIVRMFKWAAGCEMVPGSIFQSLSAVPGLRRGRTDAKESDPVKPVPEAAIAAVLQHVSPTIGAMIRLQRLTGMRSGEVCIMRRCDIDTAGRIWTYAPTAHKTAHHGHSRIVRIGPKAQDILQPLLPMNPTAYIFSPAEAEAERNAEKLKHPEMAARRRSERRRRAPGGRYTVASYRRAVARACDDAFPLPAALQPDADAIVAAGKAFWKEHHRAPKVSELPDDVKAARARVEGFRAPNRWHPHQLRHNAATELRAKYGIEAARVVLGHRSAGVTEIYAEQDHARAGEIMAEVG